MDRQNEAVIAKLETAKSLMIGSGWWTNAAGYTTDAALWIDQALADLRAAASIIRGDEGSNPVVGGGLGEEDGSSRDHDHTAGVKLKSPTCGDCARARGLIVPGGIHTVSMETCANCGQEKPCSSASDWVRPGTRIHPEAWD